MKIREFEKFFESQGILLAEPDGFCFGDISGELTGIMVSFTANLPAIMASKAAGCNLMLIHERMYFPTRYSQGLLEKHLSDRINLPRIKALIDGDISVFLAAEPIEMPFMRRAFESALGLEPAEDPADPYTIQETALKDYTRQLMDLLDLDCMRITGDPSKLIRSFVIMNGGEGITRHPDCMKKYLRRDPDLIICGETDEYPQWAVRDLGKSLLQIGHTVFDNFGLRYAAAKIREWQPGIKVDFFEIPRPWRIE